MVAGKTAKSILISCGARLAPFDIKELRELMSYDELELDMLGDRKTALFVIISDTVLSGKLNDVPSGRLFRADLGFLQMCQSL